MGVFCKGNRHDKKWLGLQIGAFSEELHADAWFPPGIGHQDLWGWTSPSGI